MTHLQALDWNVWTQIWKLLPREDLISFSYVSKTAKDKLIEFLLFEIKKIYPQFAQHSTNSTYLTQVLSKLQNEARVFSKIRQCIEKLEQIDRFKVRVGNTLHEHEIRDFELKHDCTLPLEYKTFLKLIGDGISVSSGKQTSFTIYPLQKSASHERGYRMTINANFSSYVSDSNYDHKGMLVISDDVALPLNGKYKGIVFPAILFTSFGFEYSWMRNYYLEKHIPHNFTSWIEYNLRALLDPSEVQNDHTDAFETALSYPIFEGETSVRAAIEEHCFDSIRCGDIMAWQNLPSQIDPRSLWSENGTTIAQELCYLNYQDMLRDYIKFLENKFDAKSVRTYLLLPNKSTGKTALDYAVNHDSECLAILKDALNTPIN